MDKPTFLDGRYRLDRLVVAHDDVTIWAATDLARGISVQLSIFERGSSVLHQGRSERGMFVAIDSASRPALELVADEEDFERFEASPAPSAKRRVWPWAAAGLACALIALGGWHVAVGRSQPTSETTITAARLPAPVETTVVTETTPPPPPVAPAVEAQAPVAKPVAPPQHHETAAPRPKLLLPKPVKPVRPQSSAASYDPLTI